ncbi:glucose-6-phosphate isomerase [Candidatus Poriferisocius sp.]|uniref:glucose-6-phosphate isomerase n=1 Tax=Candidatus Poriferisocius sp. TaxID=3101276 RepID=UPI003B029376
MHDTGEWQALSAHREALDGVHLRDLFDRDPQRGERLVAETDGLLVDYSKNRLTDETVAMLAALADRTGLRHRIEAMLDGEPVNTTENRPAWHAALRRPDPPPEIRQQLDHMAGFAADVRGGGWQAVVNIGIGGSDLGPAMATSALAAYADADLDVRFLSNVDGAHFGATTRGLDPARTLFIVVSKTFTTTETLANAITARAWVADAVGLEKAGGNFAAVTASPDKAREFGIDANAVFAMWDWVGGRYSLASAVGLSLMIAVGPDDFADMLAGMHYIDEHYRTAPWEENLPALLGLISIWNRNFWDWPTYGLLPYAQELALFPAYIQQLDMESSGKSVRADGTPAGVGTGPVVWGQPGTNGQHAFHQLLHQGTDIVPVEFVGFCRPNHPHIEHHDLLMANLFAQAEALAFGAPDTGDPHRSFPGNRPSTVVLADQLTPRSLGQLVALYEHKVFTQATVWGINPFDQWGVELGKTLASGIAAELTGAATPDPTRDSSTQSLINRYVACRRGVTR